ncbi:MAG: iron complex outermembrane receptor protein [Arenicella sp.]|jgi:iron complex outermembrane receptor protein
MRPIQRMSRVAIAIAAATAFSGVHAAALEEIIVTAQKRAQSLQDVPISITTVDGAKIEQAGINNLEDLAAYVPNLQFTENAVATSIVMRGVGPGANQSFEQSVGLYVDGVHLGKGRQARTGLFDIERVEVLRGPQGVLFGKNTLAGAINVSSATPNPGDELGGKIAVSAESFDGRSIEGNLSGSLTDDLAVRFAFKNRENDGYLPNSFIGTDAPSVDETLWRVAATWQPTDNTTVKFKHANGDFKRVGATSIPSLIEPVQNIGAATGLAYAVINNIFPQLPVNASNGVLDLFRDSITIGGNALAASLGKATVPGEKPEGTDTQNSDTSLNIDIEFGDGYTFTSVTGYSEYEYEDGIDADFLPIKFIGRADISEFDQFSQEIRIASDASNRFSYIAGAYVEESTQEIDRIVAFDGTLGVPGFLNAVIGRPTLLALPGPTAAFLGLPAGVNGLTSFNQIARVSNWKQDTSAWAVFLQGEYQINDNWSLTAGVRYTEEDKDANAVTRISNDAGGLANPSTNPLTGAVIRGVTATTYDHAFIDSRTTDQTTPSLTLEWSQSDNSNYYLGYSEGFKSGGFNAVDDQAPDISADGRRLVNGIDLAPGQGWSYEDETANSIALGGKHNLLDGAMTFNWEIFDSEYENQQVSTFVGIGFEVRNAATSNVKGIELDLLWQATDNLRIGANVATLDATYGAFPTAGCTARQSSDIAGGAPSSGGCVVTISAGGNAISNQDLKGRTLPNAPEYSGAIFFDYNRPVSDNYEFFLSSDLNFTDKFSTTGDLDPIDFQAAFEKLNVRAGIRSDSWEFMVYGKNVTDEETASGGFDIPLLTGSHAIYTDEGAVFGARVSYSF